MRIGTSAGTNSYGHSTEHAQPVTHPPAHRLEHVRCCVANGPGRSHGRRRIAALKPKHHLTLVIAARAVKQLAVDRVDQAVE